MSYTETTDVQFISIDCRSSHQRCKKMFLKISQYSCEDTSCNPIPLRTTLIVSMRDTECAKIYLFFSGIIMRSICAYSVVNFVSMPLVDVPNLKTVKKSKSFNSLHQISHWIYGAKVTSFMVILFIMILVTSLSKTKTFLY